MNAQFSNLNCPHCGSKNLKIIKDDIFLCEYCDQKFNFDLNELAFSSENKIFREELKEEFNKKLDSLYHEKSKNKSCLVYCSNRANARKLSSTLLALLILSVFFLFASLSNLDLIVYPIISIPIITCAYILALIQNRYRYKKYAPFAEYYASLVVELDEKIALYTKLISKLSN